MNPGHAVFSIVVDDRATEAHTGLVVWNVQPIREIALDQIAWHGVTSSFCGTDRTRRADIAASAAREWETAIWTSLYCAVAWRTFSISGEESPSPMATRGIPSGNKMSVIRRKVLIGGLLRVVGWDQRESRARSGSAGTWRSPA